jgi:hypothetical protein
LDVRRPQGRTKGKRQARPGEPVIAVGLLSK